MCSDPVCSCSLGRLLHELIISPGRGKGHSLHLHNTKRSIKEMKPVGKSEKRKAYFNLCGQEGLSTGNSVPEGQKHCHRTAARVAAPAASQAHQTALGASRVLSARTAACTGQLCACFRLCQPL